MFPYAIDYKKGKENDVANARSRRYTLFTFLYSHVLSFEILKDLYSSDYDLVVCLSLV